MSFLTQKFANTFPLRSTVRVDESSTGQKLFSCFSDIAESAMVDIIKLTSCFTLEKEELHIGKLYKINLKEEDEFKADEENVMLFTFPKVHGVKSGESIELQKVEDSESFIYGAPTRIEEIEFIESKDTLVWTNNPNGKYAFIYGSKGYWMRKNNFDFYDRLFVDVQGSNVYKKERMKESERPYNGYSFVKVTGEDKFHNKIEEYIKVKRDGEYKTRKVFKRIEKVEWDGFDGYIDIRVGECKQKDILDVVKKNKFKIVSNKIRSGLCELEVSKNEIEFESGVESVFYLDIFGRFVIDESLVKTGSTYEKDLIRGKIAGSILVDKEYEFLEPVDFLISDINSRLYVLDAKGRINIFDLSLSPFLETENKRTLGVPIQTRLLTQRVPYGKDLRCQCELRNNIGSVKSWEIKAVSPSGINYFLKYSYDSTLMKSSLLWLDGSYLGIDSFENKPLVSLKRMESNVGELSWKDFNFKINCDEIGQWDVFTRITYAEGEEYIHKTSFICESLVPVETFQTKVESPTGIFFNEENNLCLKNANGITVFKESFDVYMADVASNRIIFREKYEEVEVVYE